MAHVKKGLLSKPPEWWKHLKYMKKIFWNKEKTAVKKDIKKQLSDYQHWAGD
jgi:hypothetical protein